MKLPSSLSISLALITVTASASAASAKTIPITLNSNNTFTPSEITAASGDTLEFIFGPRNHSVAMGEFDSVNGPCVPSNKGGFWSGFVPVGESEEEAEETFRVVVNSTEPMVFYCTQASHCPKGMIGTVNAKGNASLSSYAAAAAKLSSGVSPSGPSFGGTWGKKGESTDNGTSSNSDSDSGDVGSGVGRIGVVETVVGLAVAAWVL